jgi:hypothetical protein
MAYVPAMFVAILLIFCDIFVTSIRSTFTRGGDVGTYVLLSVHEVVAVSEGVIIFAFFSYTIWFTAGLLGHLAFTVKVTLPLWVLRLAFITIPRIYAKFISQSSRDWSDPLYAVLFCLDLLSCVSLSVSLMYTVSALSEKRMYAPYHQEWAASAADIGAAVSPPSRMRMATTTSASQRFADGSNVVGSRGVTFDRSGGLPM